MRSSHSSATDVVVVSPSPLLAETVRAALVGSDVDATSLPWLTEEDRVDARTALAERTSGLLLLVLEPPTVSATHDARDLVSTVPMRSVTVVGGLVEGPEWGAMLDAGADLVLAAGSTLDEVLQVIQDPETARSSLDTVARQRLTHAWRAAQEREVLLLAQMRTLTPRERLVLQMLHSGSTVSAMAESTRLAEWTVRGHLKSMRRKLGVDSQLAAIAAYERFRRDCGELW